MLMIPFVVVMLAGAVFFRHEIVAGLRDAVQRNIGAIVGFVFKVAAVAGLVAFFVTNPNQFGSLAVMATALVMGYTLIKGGIKSLFK